MIVPKARTPNGLEDETIGLESRCVGGGQGMAMIVERLA
jgi:acetyl-CoA acetyltransferase